MRSIVVAVVLCSSLGARADAPPRTLTVACHDEPPFTMKQADGSWTGIGIELLRMIGTELGATIAIHESTRVEMTTGALPDVDIVAALNVTEKMNGRYELSHAFYNTGLAIAIQDTPKESVLGVLGRVFSGTFLWVLIGTVVLLGTVGMLMWRIERRPVPSKTPEQQALSKALFWAFEPVIGYKASQHQTRAGRVLGTVWGCAASCW